MVLGIDFGDSRTGFAISDSLEIMASTVETFKEKNMKKVVLRAIELLEELHADKIVLGFPKNMNGTVGDRGKKSQRFAKELRALTDVPVILWDERLTTVSAHNLMNETNVRGQKRKDSVDKIAAAFILQSYLDSQRNA
ncbi:MAG: Holliday junction resolvase RuvX [Clostridia bacterium]|nr:Holliday junction resolvase RuvX [Clostridia bacterium]